MHNYKIIHLEEIDGTNSEAKRRISKNQVSDYCVIIADSQTSGKGRYGRNWASASGNLFCSIVLPSEKETELMPQLSFVAGLAVREAIAECNSQTDRIHKANAAPNDEKHNMHHGPIPSSRLNQTYDVKSEASATYIKIGEHAETRKDHMDHLKMELGIKIKWPNDILFNGKKVAGILLESLNNKIIIGVGVNLAGIPEGFENSATSLYEESGKLFNNLEFLEKLLHYFDKYYNLWLKDGFCNLEHINPINNDKIQPGDYTTIMELWLQEAAFLGQNIVAKTATKEITGRFISIDQNGAIIIKQNDKIVTITPSEIWKF